MGLLLAVLVTAADVEDAKAAQELFGRWKGRPMSRSRGCSPAASNTTTTCTGGSSANASWRVVAIRRPDGANRRVGLPTRWTVEHTFAWLGKGRRLSKDRERSTLSSESFVKLAMIHLMLNRLRPKGNDTEFHYRFRL